MGRLHSVPGACGRGGRLRRCTAVPLPVTKLFIWCSQQHTLSLMLFHERGHLPEHLVNCECLTRSRSHKVCGSYQRFPLRCAVAMKQVYYRKLVDAGKLDPAANFSDIIFASKPASGGAILRLNP